MLKNKYINLFILFKYKNNHSSKIILFYKYKQPKQSKITVSHKPLNKLFAFITNTNKTNLTQPHFFPNNLQRLSCNCKNAPTNCRNFPAIAFLNKQLAGTFLQLHFNPNKMFPIKCRIIYICLKFLIHI